MLVRVIVGNKIKYMPYQENLIQILDENDYEATPIYIEAT